MSTRQFLLASFAIAFLGCSDDSNVRANDEDCEVELRVTLSGAASSNYDPWEGVGYPNIQGFQILQYLPDNHGALAVDSGGDALGNLSAFVSGNVNAMGEKGTIIFVNTLREYSEGEILSKGVYVYDGMVSYEGADGAQHTVRAFHQMDEDLARLKVTYYQTHDTQRTITERAQLEKLKNDLAEREKREKRKQEKEDRLAKPVEGYSIDLPSTHKVRAICGIKFGVSPADAESHLGERIEGRPIAVQLKKHAGLITATYKLKKPFRHFDRAKINYSGEPPYCVVEDIELLGYVQADAVSEGSCCAEIKKVAELLNEHYNLGHISENRDGKSYDVGREEDSIWVAYDSGKFRIRISKSFHERIKELQELDRQAKDAAKKSVEFSDSQDVDVL